MIATITAMKMKPAVWSKIDIAVAEPDSFASNAIMSTVIVTFESIMFCFFEDCGVVSTLFCIFKHFSRQAGKQGLTT